jgi:hypothetical protein
MFQRSSWIAALGAVITLSSAASASFSFAVTPGFRGGPCSRFAGFEVFGSAYNGANQPDVPGSTATSATITQTVPGAILTGTGNIYHMSAASHFVLADSGVDDVQQVVFQTSSLGNSRDIATFTLFYTNALGQEVSLAPTEFIPLYQQAQQHDELYFRWDLSGIPEVVTTYRIEWSASLPNMSFDGALLDVLTQCAPGTPVCLGDGSGIACPCGNSGATSSGCANSVEANGARLSSIGIPSIASDTFVLAGSGMPNGPCLYLQSTDAAGSGQGFPFGDGILCAAGTITRLGVSINALGASTFPTSGTTLSSIGGVTSSGTLLNYQVWYRDAASFCSTATFNLTNGYQITWAP